ncbi:MAG: DUF2256 domain-containing protein [Alphaproteobacteria bacterium]
MRRRANDKAALPQKICAACGRPFAWRKTWAKDWAALRYCSERCRRQRPRPRSGPS